MLIDVSPEHLYIIRQILKESLPEKTVVAFGSRAKWTARDTSDLDLCIMGEEKLEPHVLYNVCDQLGTSDIPYKIDLIEWARLSPEFKEIVARDQVGFMDEDNFYRYQFFHYKPLSTPEHFDWLCNYMKQKVWFTSLQDLNDPFEASLLWQEKEEKINSAPWPTHSTLCITSSPSNIPMWAHYANNHQGYCVIFEIDLNKIYKSLEERVSNRAKFDEYMMQVFHPRDRTDQEILLFHESSDSKESNIHFIFTKVLYKDKRPILDITEVREMEKKYADHSYPYDKYLSQHSFGVKFKQWDYEEEYRLLSNANSKNSGLMDLRPYPIKVTGIIMGSKISPERKKDIIKLGKEHGIEIFHAECSPHKYEIKIQKQDVPLI